ncbi:MAG: septum formation initiator family protein [Clostridia bacterium]|nr:septum formation initiator family protein [Clostridia bacterium]
MRENKKTICFSKSNIVVIGALVIVVGIAVGIFISSIMEYHVLKDARTNVENEAKQVQDQIDKQEHDIAAEMDDEYIESVAKDKLDLINPDEIIVHGND